MALPDLHHYVNNRELFEEVKIYYEAFQLAKQNKSEPPVVSNKICAAIMQIATRMMNSHNFCRYTYKEDMVSAAIQKCFNKVHTFDPSKSENPFAFFSQCCWNEAIHFIKNENHQSSVKARLIRNKLSDEFVQHGVDIEDTDESNSFVQFLLENDAYVDYYEQAKEKAERERENPSVLTKHRNKTPYKKKADTIKEVQIVDVNIFE